MIKNEHLADQVDQQKCVITTNMYYSLHKEVKQHNHNEAKQC